MQMSPGQITADTAKCKLIFLQGKGFCDTPAQLPASSDHQKVPRPVPSSGPPDDILPWCLSPFPHLRVQRVPVLEV